MSFLSKISACVALVVCVALLSTNASANRAAILTIKIGDSQVAYTRGDLEALSKTRILTSTPWTEGVAEFEGVRLTELVNSQGGRFSKIKATALNDYSATMDIADVLEDGVIAYRLNGEPMTVRQKGPLWIVFPFDAKPSLKSERYYSKSVWQLKALELLN